MSLPAHIWINGRVVPLEDARVSPFDHGFLVGDGVFETLVARNGKPFTAVRHWRRLTHSCEVMDITAPSFEIFIAAIADVMEANGMPDARIRFTVTSGDGPLGSDRGDSPVTMTCAATALKPWPPTESAVTVPWTRNERGGLAGVKSTSYGENVRALAAAKARGAGEALLANTRGELCEGTGTNVFIVEAGVVKTPPLRSGCLAGVTRALVIEACEKAGIAIEEADLPLSVLQSCDEAFLSSSTRDVHPLARVDDRVLPGIDGPVTRRVAQAFRDFIAGRDDP
ncbi:MAG: aminotransferase class IV [Verrucomicrobiaceae bacterium]|nr:aminotransferase class IV [Verrucomicrobiaceae bacterium]MBE7498704.1 aminotransferase class IV [Verrucomicrobiaceae bacterium]